MEIFHPTPNLIVAMAPIDLLNQCALDRQEQRHWHPYEIIDFLMLKGCRRKMEFIAGRQLARKAAAVLFGNEDSTIWVRRKSSGAVYLYCETRPLARLSISHSGNWVAVAISAHNEVGLDIESYNDKYDNLDIARRFFHPDEVKLLDQTEETKKQQLFFLMWTRKEALAKMTEQGIAHTLKTNVINIQCGSYQWYSQHFDMAILTLVWMRSSQLPQRWKEIN